MRRFVLNILTLIIINCAILPASALADDSATEVRAYITIPLAGDSLTTDTTIGMQLRDTSAFDLSAASAGLEPPLLDLGLKLNTGDVSLDGAELLIFGAPVAVNDADLGLVWMLPDFAEPKNTELLPSAETNAVKQECALSRC